MIVYQVERAIVNRGARWILGAAVILLVGGFFAGRVEAATPRIAILSPSPNGVYMKDTNITFELQITSGLDPGFYKIGWDFDDLDGVDYPPGDETPCLNFTGSVIYPVRYTAQPRFRVAHLYPSGGSTPTADGEHVVKFRLRKSQVSTCSGLVNVVESSPQSVFLTADLRFTGYSWLGASTGICSGGLSGSWCNTDAECGVGGTCRGQNDAQGWTSFNCANLGSCNSPLELLNAYSVQAIHTASPNFSKMQNAGWQGLSSTETGAQPVGWLTFNKGTCTDVAHVGTPCVSDAGCSGVGSCQLTRLSTETVFPGGVNEEKWQNANEYVHLYSSYTTVDLIPRVPGQISGWGRFLTLRDYGSCLNPAILCVSPSNPKNDWGWTHLRGPVVPTTAGANRYQFCTDCSGGASALPTEVKCNICNGWQDIEGTLQRYSCNSCYDCDTSLTSNIKCRSCDQCNRYGVSFDAQKTQLTGFAWTGRQDADENGFGWMDFNPAIGGVSILQAWLATRFGDIFVGGPITAGPSRASPASQYNATYVIQANGTIAFTSRIGQRQENYPGQIPLPSQSTQYINVLGRLNLDEMRKIGTNRYGTTVDVLAEQPGASLASYLATQASLGGRIFYYHGNASVDSELVLPSAAPQNGSGTFIINGDLTINANIKYRGLTPGSLAELPSVAWIVLGDVKISPTVGTSTDYTASTSDPNIVGAFLVLGNGGQSTSCDPSKPSGIVCTGTFASQTVNDLELIVSGMMMAREFNFQRRVISPQGSEQIVYDGRFIANPPPGLQDLSAVLPAIREVAP